MGDVEAPNSPCTFQGGTRDFQSSVWRILLPKIIILRSRMTLTFRNVSGGTCPYKSQVLFERVLVLTILFMTRSKMQALLQYMESRSELPPVYNGVVSGNTRV
jgi:hypothetical protein